MIAKQPTTYRQFLTQSQRAQAQYIRTERKRMAKLQRAWFAYVDYAASIGLHPLNRKEIEDRQRQLDDMERRIAETHGDTPTQRSIWEARQTETTTP